jgi:hypothetical protein
LSLYILPAPQWTWNELICVPCLEIMVSQIRVMYFRSLGSQVNKNWASFSVSANILWMLGECSTQNTLSTHVLLTHVAINVEPVPHENCIPHYKVNFSRAEIIAIEFIT